MTLDLFSCPETEAEPDQGKKKRKRRGKDWEHQVRDACNAAGLFSIGLDNIGQQFFPTSKEDAAFFPRTPKRDGDRVVCYRGAFLLLEAKEAERYFLDRMKFTAEEEEALYAVTVAQGLAVVPIRHRPEGERTWKAWLVHYADLMAAIRQTGTKRLRFDRPIPACFVPLIRKTFEGGRREWDIATALEALIQQKAPIPYHLDPEQELGRRAKASAKKQAVKDKRAAEARAKRGPDEPPF